MKAKFYLIILFTAILHEVSAEVLIRKDLAYLDSKNVRNLLDVYYLYMGAHGIAAIRKCIGSWVRIWPAKMLCLLLLIIA
jgi:hypothetical protein